MNCNIITKFSQLITLIYHRQLTCEKMYRRQPFSMSVRTIQTNVASNVSHVKLSDTSFSNEKVLSSPLKHPLPNVYFRKMKRLQKHPEKIKLTSSALHKTLLLKHDFFQTFFSTLYHLENYTF